MDLYFDIKLYIYKIIFFTSCFSRDYSSVQEVLDRISAVKSEAIVKQVGAIYLFDVKEKGKYHIDFKNGSGAVGEGEYLHFVNSFFDQLMYIQFNRKLAYFVLPVS